MLATLVSLAVMGPFVLAVRGERIPLILEGAYRQVGVTVHYDGSYRVIPFPGGDVPKERGVCTDVIVRAYRHAGLDLQLLVHRAARGEPVSPSP